MADLIVSATSEGESPNPPSKSALTGTDTDLAMYSISVNIVFLSTLASVEQKRLSGRPSEKAMPALVVPKLLNPEATSTFALPASHAFGIKNASATAMKFQKLFCFSKLY